MRKTIVLLITLLLIGATDLFSQNEIPQLSAVDTTQQQEIKPAFPVILFSDTLFYVDAKQASLGPRERAVNISKRLLNIFEDDSANGSEVYASLSGNYVDIVCGDVIIMSLSEEDALSQNTTNELLALHYIQIIKSSFAEAKKDRDLVTVIIRIVLVLLVLAGIFLLITLIRRGYEFVLRKITENKDKWLKSLSYKDYTFLTAEQELNIALWLLKILKWFVVIILVYMLLPLIFSIFPFSRGWANTLFGFVWGPFKGMMLSIWDYLPNLFTIIVIYFIFKYLIRFVKYVFDEIEGGNLKISGFHQDWALPTFSIVKFLLYAFMFVLIFPYLPGSDSGIFRGVSVFIGILFSLGSSTAISNMVAGFVITYMRPFKIGDRIKIGEIVGDVVEKTMLVTRLRTLKNEEITIPNAAVLSGNTTNYSALAKTDGLILHTTVTIGYDVSWRNMHKALLEAAARTPNLMTEKKPFVLQTSLDDFYVSYQLNVYTTESNVLAPIYSDLHKHILDVCAEMGIEIMSPHYRAERDGNEITIPRMDGAHPNDKNVN
ncbi:MAG: mechanosensitive ion channel family protein [Paludibacter sp.]|nr:mechanosensitive ion channel family protein [Paludibacter sp.]